MQAFRKLFLPTAAVALVLGISGCSNDSSGDTDSDRAFSLSVLHINDHHSHTVEASATIMLDGIATKVKLGGFPRATAKFSELESKSTNVMKLHAGDALAGTLYFTLFKGEVDAELMNDVCFDAFVVGNHEFDNSDAGLKIFADFLRTDASCSMPILGANVVPEVGTPLAPSTPTDYITPYMIKEMNGEKVGVIGIEIASKTRNSSNPLDTTQLLDETVTAQKYIDELTAQGINKIALLTHNQYRRDIAMASKLSGLDFIIDGDSHTLLGGDEFTELGFTPAGPYPTVVKNKDGDTVCVAQAWQYASIVGELKIEFDSKGVVTSCAGTPHMLIGDTFSQKDDAGEDAPLTGDALTAAISKIDSLTSLSIVTEDAGAIAIVDKYSTQVEILQNEQIGLASEDLCFERVPGQGRSEIAGCKESTNARGSDISNIVARAFRDQSIDSDFSIQNGGGVRIDVPAGKITVGTAYTLLPFSNTLYNLDMTGAEIKAVLEDALDAVVRGSTGSYPYASGLRWDVDMSKDEGSRILNLQARLKSETEWVAIDTAKLYKVVTNSYTAGGKDGYYTFASIADNLRVDTYLDYAESFVNYVKKTEVVNKLPIAEYSTQSFTNSEGILQK